MKQLANRILILLAAVLFVALPASSNAQPSPDVNAIGSSGLFLELGEAAFTLSLPPGAAVACAWSTSTSSLVVATDTSSGTNTDTGNAWVVWFAPTGSTCSSNVVPVAVYGYLQTDSVVGDRCLFNGTASKCSISYTSAVGTAGANLIEPTEFALPAMVASALNGAPNVAGTDIRPEDAEFATARALTTCGTPIPATYGSVTTTQYEGLGYTAGDNIESETNPGTGFHALDFTLPATFFTQPVGADPVVVFVHSTDASGTGFNNTSITNLNRSTLALYLDGSIGETRDALTPGATGTSEPTTVFIREPLSGTYNTMEYNIPNSLELQTSQDVGEEQPSSQKNCSGSAVGSNPMNIENTNFTSFRKRAIGTGQEVSAVFGNNDSLGYAFWGVTNFKAATSTDKYLTVDGVDPLLTSYTTLNGTIPTTATQLANVKFPHIVDGTYPIWSLLRLVYVNSSLSTATLNLAEGAASFTTPMHPDFVPYYVASAGTTVNLKVERSHFIPPAGTIMPATPINGECASNPTALTTEAGGDVGGVVIPCAVDADYKTTTGSTYIDHRN
ncbi:hypothetical protein [Paracidobacterium acidisoli]|uniref:Uncharacterized protein n=1 Tax=Paracidobacterium acidisoli TaxID=2303751 RepID=A0A372IKC2_9BACT|nr:hypothetical protein [Paracidobacterium acidisoli]MBT9333099.1 hypothetical protein [Paracidobacterium acidisoli]